MRTTLSGALIFCALMSACVPRTFSETSEVDVEQGTKDFAGKETFLLLGEKGELALAATAPLTVKPLRAGQGAELPRLPSARSFRGKFYVLTLGAKSFIEVISPDAPESVEKIGIDKEVFNEARLPEDMRQREFHPGLVMDAAGGLLLTVPGKSSVFLRAAGENVFTSFVDLGGVIHGGFQLREMTLVDKYLFVQVHRFERTMDRSRPGALAVIDTTARSVVKVIDLVGEKPCLAMDFDALRKKLWVVAAGTQNQDNGALNRIDVDPASPKFLSVDHSTKLGTFEGAVALGKDFGSIFYAEHTATPTRSTHLHHFLLGPAGTLDDVVEGPTRGLDLTTAFEGSDDLQVSDTRDLAVMSFNCRFAGCPRGAGLYLFDGATGMPYRKLYTKGKVPPDVVPPPETTIPFFVSGFAILRK